MTSISASPSSVSTLSSSSGALDAQTISFAQASPSFSLRGMKHASMAKIDAVSQDFEAQFVSQMFSTMYDTLDLKNGLGGSEEEGTFQSMLINEYGKVIARAGGIGIAAQVKQEMLKMQEVKS